jgi:predicted dehydrogenase
MVSKNMEYLQKAESGGNDFTIMGGHSLDALFHVLGLVEELSASATIQLPQVALLGTDRKTERTAPDHYAFSGRLASGVFLSFTIRGLSAGGQGLRFEVNGEKGTLLVTAGSPNPMIQISALTLARVGEDGTATPIEAVGPHTLGVAQNYVRLVEAIRGGRPEPASFADALDTHRLLEAISLSAREGRRVKLA